MQLEQLRQLQGMVSKCGKLGIVPPGTFVVPLERKILLPMLLQPNQAKLFAKEVVGDTVFELRAISCDRGMTSLTGVRAQIQLPNGRFLFGGNGQDVGQFAFVGSYKYAVNPPIECQPGSKFQCTLTDMVGLGAAFPCNLVFEGVEKYYGPDADEPGSTVVDSDRLQRIVNENILAPCFLGGFGPRTPEGYDDKFFTYSSDLATIQLAGPLFTSLKIPIDSGLDFQGRRLLIEQKRSSALVTAGSVLGRLRAGAGYALSDDYIDLARYLGGAEWPHDWKVRGQDAIYVDLQLVDAVGTGSISFRAHVEGVRRRRVSGV